MTLSEIRYLDPKKYEAGVRKIIKVEKAVYEPLPSHSAQRRKANQLARQKEKRNRENADE